MARLQKANITIPLGGKLTEQVDERLLDKGGLAKAENVLFDKHGAVTKAKGCEIVSFAPERAGVLLEDGFALESIKDGDRDLLLAGGYLEDASDYSYLDEYYQCCVLDEQLDIMRPRGFWPPITQRNWIAAYSQITTSTFGVFKDPCIARLGGYLWHVWIELYAGTHQVFLSVVEEATGAVVLERKSIMGTGTNKIQPHIVAVGTGALHVFARDTLNLLHVILDPTDPTNPSGVYTDGTFDATDWVWDLCTLVDPTHGDVSCVVYRDDNSDLRARCWDAAGVLRRNATLATAVGGFIPIGAVGCARVDDKTTGTGTYLAYVFVDDAAPDQLVYGMVSEDLATPHISNVNLLDLTGYTVEQLTMAEEPADAWETGAGNSAIRIWAETTEIATTFKRVRTVRAKFAAPGGIIGAEDVSWYHYRIQSKAFYHKGRSHCWLRYSPVAAVGFYQPSGVLAAYREKIGTTCLPMSEAYNFHDTLGQRTDQGLPDVIGAGTNEFLWTTLRQEFDESFTLRACVLDYNVKGLRPASLNPSLLFGGGLVHCFDGRQQDHGLFHSPGIMSLAAAAGAGALTLGATYQWLVIYEWTDRNGLWHASEPSIPRETTLAGGDNQVTLKIQPLGVGEWYRNAEHVRAVIYRTLAGGSEFHYEGFAFNDPGAFYVDFLSDDADTVIEPNRLAYTDGSPGSALENTCPPPMTQIVQHQDRLLGISEENSNEVWFTKPESAGVAPEWSIYQVQRFPVSLVGLTSMEDYWIAFSDDNRIYAVAGAGPDVFGVAGEFLQPRLISQGTGLANPRFLERTDIGICFESERGIETLLPCGKLARISDPVESEFYTGQDLARCVPDPVNSRIYVVGLSDTGLMLVYDYKHDRWTTLTARGIYPRDATLHQGDLYTLHKDGKIRKAAGYLIDGSTSAVVSMKLITPWLRAGNLTGFQRTWWANILGMYYTPHTLRIKQYVDYDKLTAVDQHDFVIASQATGYPYNFRWKPGRQKFAAVKFSIEDLAQTTPYKSADWVALELTAGFKGPLPKRSKNFGG